MKREIYIYSVLGVFTCFLIFYQFNFNLNETGAITSKIKPITKTDQVLIDIKCNVFLVEGDGQHILVEGPEKEIQQIQANTSGGYIRITKDTDTFLFGILSIFNSKENDINIYITVNDLDNFKFSYIDELKGIKYTSEECIGLILSKGQKLIIESKFINSRV